MSTGYAAAVAGDVWAAARVNDLPQGVLALASSTSSSSATSSTTELDVLTASAVTLAAADRRIRLRWHCRAISATVGGSADIFTVRIKEGATVLNESNYLAVATAAAATGGCDFEAIVTSPTAAAHTYKVTIQRAIGSGNATVTASATAPMTLTVEDAGKV